MKHAVAITLLLLTGTAVRADCLGWAYDTSGNKVCVSEDLVNRNPTFSTPPHHEQKKTECDPPKRWVEIDALADDAGRPSKLICK